MAAKQKKGSAGAPAWMATFADLATLLMCFFVLLLSFSEMDVQKYKLIMGSMREAFGVQRENFAKQIPKGTSFVATKFTPGKPDTNPIETIQQDSFTPRNTTIQDSDDERQSGAGQADDRDQMSGRADTREQISEQNEQTMTVAEYRRLKEMEQAQAEAKAEADKARIERLLEEEINRGLVDVDRRGTQITIRIRERGSFPSGKAELIQPFDSVLKKIGLALEMTDGRIVVSGHTDNVPISTSRFRSNWELSAARAVTMVHELEEKSRVDPERITIQGYGETRPLVPNDTAAQRAQNRRVEVTIVQGQVAELLRSADELQVGPGG